MSSGRRPHNLRIAPTTIQACVRGWITRRSAAAATTAAAALVAARDHPHYLPASAIQASVRGWLVRSCILPASTLADALAAARSSGALNAHSGPSAINRWASIKTGAPPRRPMGHRPSAGITEWSPMHPGARRQRTLPRACLHPPGGARTPARRLISWGPPAIWPTRAHPQAHCSTEAPADTARRLGRGPMTSPATTGLARTGTNTGTPRKEFRPTLLRPARGDRKRQTRVAVSDLDPIFQDGILRNRMGAAAACSGAPCVPTATLGPWDIPPPSGMVGSSITPFIIK